MPKRKASRRSPSRSRTRTIVRTVRRRVGAVRHRVGSKMPGGHWGTLAVNFLAGYLLPGAIQDSGLADAVYQNTPGMAGDMLRKMSDTSGIGLARSVGKAGGALLFMHELHKHPNSPITNKSAFAIGLIADDPVGQTAQGSTGTWVS